MYTFKYSEQGSEVVLQEELTNAYIGDVIELFVRYLKAVGYSETNIAEFIHVDEVDNYDTD